MSTNRYLIPAQRVRVEEEYSRSRFITTIGHAPTVEAARAFIAEVSAEYADASHNCWAYVVGAPGSTAQNGMSDDGEPHGTAGRPMLTVLLHSNVGEVVVVVTRYFGGTLLGKGGLVKAYSGGVQLALRELPTVERVEKCIVEAVIDYSALVPIKRLLAAHEAEIVGEEFAQDITLRLELPEANRERLVAEIIEITNGQALIE
jgi:uncharacterized YigZ family protein